MLAPNSILQNRYRIVRKLGQGGMGTIYEAIDERVSCVVALKETLVGASSTLREAFQREAALLANLRHPLLPKVMDYFGEGDGEFLVMEYITGDDLLELLAQRERPLPQQQVLPWAIELLKLLEYLHAHDPAILHRDIKPANLKVTKDGDVFLLDFGLAKGSTGQMVTVETERSVPGYTPIYAPLEQIIGQGTDARSDLYAMGASLYHLLTGHPPMSAAARFSALENNQPDPLKPANQLNAEIASEVADCIHNAMAVSRRDRTESAQKMRVELEHALKLIVDRENADRAEQDLLSTTPERDPSKPLVLDENVQFSVYAPEKIKPEKNYSLLAFAHLTKRRDDAEPDELDPIEEVKSQAARLLGDHRDDYRDTKDSSSQPVPRGGEITFVPVVRGLTFNPPSRSFTWQKSVHREEFDVRATSAGDGQTLSGSLTVFLGSVVIAEVRIAISIDSQVTPARERVSLERSSARRVKQVFASYSREDEQVVNELAQVAPLFGSRFLLDRTHLEPGEDRVEGLQRLIRNADVFQLFWSTNSMRSAEVADEIKYAAGLGRPGFILPTHWEDPVPRSPSEGLPPPEVDRLQFYRINPGAISGAMFAKPSETRLVVLGPPGAQIYVDDERQGSIGSSGRVILKSVSTGQHVLRVTRYGYRDDERLIDVRSGGGEQIFQTFSRPPISAAGAPSFSTVEIAAEKMTAPVTEQFDAPTGELEAPLSDQTPEPFSEPTSEVSAPASSPPFSDSYQGDQTSHPLSCHACGALFYDYSLSFCVNCGSALHRSDMVSSRPQASNLEFPPPANYQRQSVPKSAGMSPVAKGRRGMLIPIFAGVAMVLFAIVITPVWFMMSKTETASMRPPTSTNSAANTNTAANANREATSNVNSESRLEVQFVTLAGTRKNLSDFRGRVVLVNFWATRSESSRLEIPLLNDLQKTYGRRGLDIIGLSYDTAEQVRTFQNEIPIDYQIGLVGRMVQGESGAPMAPQVSTFPTTYIIDRQGRVRKKTVGAQSREAYEDAIQPLINEQP